MKKLGGRRWKRVLGLTGGLGSGKSTVLGMLKSKGAYVLDADAIVGELLQERPTLAQIRRAFGPGVFDADGRLDKKEMAARIFKSVPSRRKLEKIIHPQVRSRIEKELRQASGAVAVCDIPLLFERGWKSAFDALIVVDASDRVRERRLMKRGLGAADIKARFKAQWPLKEKVKRADFVVDNNGSKKNTKNQVQRIWNTINEERP